MKKRLLITSALMTAVLGASLATGTYAWYAATAGGVDYSQADNEVVTALQNYSASDISLSGAWGELEEDVALSDAAGVSKHISGGNLVTDAGANVFGVTTFTVTSASNVNDLAAVSGAYKVTVTAYGQVRLLKDDGTAGAVTANEETSHEYTFYITQTGTLSTVSAADTGVAATTGLSWDIYYSIKTVKENTTEDTVQDHANDALGAVISA